MKANKEYIRVYGAKEHNLKNVFVNIPRNELVVVTGISGSGKSSLAFDTIFAEGQRRYLETLSSYARQFIGSIERPDVEKIDGLSPVISIEQKTVSKSPRSTVGTITEIYDFIRLLYDVLKWKTLQITGLGNPVGPGGGPALPPASPKLDGIWISSGGGTIHFRGNNPITAESNVPFFGRSDLRITPNGDGTYNFTYQQRGGFRDSGYGKLTPRNGNTIDAYLINGMGIKVDFVLTR